MIRWLMTVCLALGPAAVAGAELEEALGGRLAASQEGAMDDRGRSFYSSAALLVMQVDQGESYAISDSGTSDIFAGNVKRAQLDWTPGFELGFGMRTDTGWDLSATYTHVDARDKDSVFDPTDSLSATQVHADFFADVAEREITRATAEIDLEYKSIDLLIRRAFSPADDLRVGFSAGPQVVLLSRNTHFLYDDDGTLTGDIVTVDKNLDFRGYGLQIGVDGEWRAPMGFSVYGGLSISALAGETRWVNREFEPDDGDLNLDVEDEYRQIVSMLSLGTGVRWSHAFSDRVSIEAFAGWDFKTLLGLQARRFPDDVVDAVLVEENLEFSMHGLSSGVTLVF